MNNMFISFCEYYFKFINEELNNVDKIYSKRKIGSKKIIFDDKLKKEFDIISKHFSDDCIIFEDYCSFIRFAEKCFMYKNCETSNIYADIMDNKKILYYKNNDYKVKITYEITKIKKIGSNVALSLIEDEETNIKFINIEIVRNYGKQMKNIYKFVSGEEINIEESDKILLNVILRKMNREIFDSFCEILKSIISIYTGITIDEEIKMTEVIENGLWIRKCSNK